MGEQQSRRGGGRVGRMERTKGGMNRRSKKKVVGKTYYPKYTPAQTPKQWNWANQMSGVGPKTVGLFAV